jgi:hypothetical protein
MDSRQLIEKYHHAWTNSDFVTARACLEETLDFQGSINTFSNADDFIAVLTQMKLPAASSGVSFVRNSKFRHKWRGIQP